MTTEEKNRISEVILKLTDEYGEQSKKLLSEGKLEEASKATHKALGMVILGKAVLYEMADM